MHTYITRNPSILSGKPSFTGTRIGVEMILKMLGTGWSIDQILQEYPTLSKEHIDALFLFSSSLITNEEVEYA